MSRFSKSFSILTVVVLLFFGVASTASAKGGVVEKSETQIQKQQLPDAVSKALAKTEYANWQIVERAKVQSREHGTIFEVEVEKEKARRGVYFSSEGKLIDIEVE